MHYIGFDLDVEQWIFDGFKAMNELLRAHARFSDYLRWMTERG